MRATGFRWRLRLGLVGLGALSALAAGAGVTASAQTQAATVGQSRIVYLSPDRSFRDACPAARSPKAEVQPDA